MPALRQALNLCWMSPAQHRNQMPMIVRPQMRRNAMTDARTLLNEAAEPMSNDDVVDVLNDLLETTRDGGFGFLACAEEVKSPSLKETFVRRAETCKVAETELMALIRNHGGKPAEGGTAAGAMHRGWVHLKGSMGANTELSILESCERGEDAAVAQYRKALKQNLPPDVRAAVQRQAEGAQSNHDQIRDLRNAAQSVKA
jgi:uncharacterized protein (TIGR02284 family)